MPKNPFRAKSVMWTIVALAAVVFTVFFKNIIFTNAAEISTQLTINNIPPVFATPPSDGGSSALTPTNAGNNVTFTATGHDSNGDKYYLAICKTDQISEANNNAPSCPGGSWGISGETNTDIEASVIYTTSTGDAESNDWYAFICDKNSPSTCSISSQGSGLNGSPFNVNHRPTIGNVNIGPTCGPAVMNPNSWYSFNSDISGDAITNNITNGIGATCSGNECPTWTASGKYNGAFQFDGTNDHFTTSATFDTSAPFTISAWVKRGAVSNATEIIMGSANCNGWSLSIRSDNTIGLSQKCASEVASQPTIADTAWHHIAVTDNGSETIFFIDGVKGNPWSSYMPVYNSGGGLYLIGGDTGGSYFNGMIDDLTLYNDVLSDDNIAYIAANGQGLSSQVPPGNSKEMKITNGVLSGDDEAYSTKLQSDGKIVSVGYSNNGTDNDFSVVRYDADGTMDPNFSGDGKVTTAMGSGDDRATSVFIQNNNKIVVAGYTWNGSNFDFAVARYNYNGTLDTSFGSGGKVTTPVGSGDDKANAVAVYPNGKIVVAGYSHNGSNNIFALVRYNPDGSIDTTFDSDGIVTTAVESGNSVINSLALQSDGKIVAAGYSYNGSHNNFAVTRYNYNGSLDTTSFGTLGTGGIVTTAVGLGDSIINSVALQPNGKIVVTGKSNNGSNNDVALVRYNINGTLDNTANSGNGSGITPHGTVTTPYPQQADILLSENGGYITWYLLYAPTGEHMIAVQKIDANGGPLWGDGVIVNTNWSSGSHGSVWLSTDGNGGAFITWTDETFVRTQRVNSSGNTVFPTPVIADISGSCGGGTPDIPWMGPGSYGWEGNFPWNKFVTYDGEGGIIMFWDSGFYGANLCAQKVDANGNRQWTDNGVIMPRGSGWLMTLTSDGNGGAYFASGIMIESHIWHIDDNGNFVSGCNNTSLSNKNIIDLTHDGSGNVVVLFNGGFAGSPLVDAQTVTANSYGPNCVHNPNWPSGGVTVSTNLKPWYTNIQTQVFADKMLISWIDSEPTDTYATLINSYDGSNVWGGTKTVATEFDTEHNFSWTYAVPSGTDYLFFSVKSANSANPSGGAILSKLNGATGNPVPAFGGELNIEPSYVPVTITSDGSNGFVIIYQVAGNTQLFSQRYNSSGTETWASLNSVVVSAPVSQGSVLSTNGYVVTPVGSGNDEGTSVAIQSDGKIVITGISNNGTNNDFALLRYNDDGSLDTSFSTDGILTTSIGSGNDNAYSTNVQTDGRIIVTGYSNNGSNNDFALVRYNTDGTIHNPTNFACIQADLNDPDSDTAPDTINMHVCSTNSFSNGACTGTTLCSISGILTGGQAECLMEGEVPIPTAHGTYNVYIFLTDNNTLTDLGVNNEQNYDVADVQPVLSSYTATDAPAPAAGGSDTVNYTVTLTDNNGDNDVTNIAGVLFDKAIVSNNCSAAENFCYPSSTCSLANVSAPGSGKTSLGTDNILTAECSAVVWYNANASDWDVEAKATDGNGITAFANAGVSLTNPSLLGIDVAEPSIAYGSVTIGGTSSDQTTTMANMGNQVLDVLIDGNQMCTDNCDYTIPTTQQKWFTSSSFDWDTDGYALVDTANSTDPTTGCYNAAIGVRADHSINSTDKAVYWKLRIPNNQKAGSYAGQNTFTTSVGGTCGAVPSTYDISGSAGEGGTVALSCNGSDTIASYISKFGIGTSCGGGAGVDCGTCTVGSSSCSVTYGNGPCGGDCAPGQSKTGSLTLTCSGTPPAVCGNSAIETGETCDDGNTNNGDGCSSTCQTESSSSYNVSSTGDQEGTISLSCTSGDPITSFSSKWGVGCSECGGGAGVNCGSCTIGSSSCSVSYGSGQCGGDCHFGCYKPSSLTITCGGTAPVCGNGITESGEECDDNNTNSGDGCSSTCTFEPFELYVDYDSGTSNQVCSSAQPCDSISTALNSSFFAAISALTSNQIPVYVRGTKNIESISDNAYTDSVLLQPWGNSHPIIKWFFILSRSNTTVDGFEFDGTGGMTGPPGFITMGGSNIIVRNSYIHNYGGVGIFANVATNSMIYNNIIANNKNSGDAYCGGLYSVGSSNLVFINNSLYENCTSGHTSYQDVRIANSTTSATVKQNIVYNSLGGTKYMFDGATGAGTVNGISLNGATYTDQTGIDFVGGENYIAATDPFTNASGATNWSTAGTNYILTTPASYSIATPAAETQPTDYLGHLRPNGTAAEAGAIENVELILYVDYDTGTANPLCSMTQPCESINNTIYRPSFAAIGSVTSNEITIKVKGTKNSPENISNYANSNPVLLQPWDSAHPIINNYFTFSRAYTTLEGFEINGSTLGGGPPGGLYFNNANNAVIRNSYVHNYPGAGIYLNGSPNSQIYNNIFANNKPSGNNNCGGVSVLNSSSSIVTNNSVYNGCDTNQTSYADMMVMWGTQNSIMKQNIVYNSLGGSTYRFEGTTGVNAVNGVNISGTLYTDQTGIDLVGGDNYIAATDPFTNASGATSWATAGTSFVLSVPANYSIATPAAETQPTDYLGNARPNGANAEAGAIED